MKRAQCKNGHYFDVDRYSTCPMCGAECSTAFSQIKAIKIESANRNATVPLPPSMRIDELAPTVALNLCDVPIYDYDNTPLAQESSLDAVSITPTGGEKISDLRRAPIEGEEFDVVPVKSSVDSINPDAEIVNDAFHGCDMSELVQPTENTSELDVNKSQPVTEAHTDGQSDSADVAVEGDLSTSANQDFSSHMNLESPDETPSKTLAQAVAKSHSADICVVQHVSTESNNVAMLPVGWIVGINGANKGRIFEFKHGRNYIGSGLGMDIVIQNEASISASNHAVIIFEPRKKQFFIQSGNSKGLTYVNDELVFTHTQLHAYDRITLEKVEFVFIPLCGDNFTWSED